MCSEVLQVIELGLMTQRPVYLVIALQVSGVSLDELRSNTSR